MYASQLPRACGTSLASRAKERAGFRCQRAVGSPRIIGRLPHRLARRTIRSRAKLDLHDQEAAKKAGLRPEEDDAEAAPSTSQSAFTWAVEGFKSMTATQRAWSVAAAIVALVAIPRALVLVLIAAERLVVGSLLATEALLASLLLRSMVVGGGVAVIGLLLWGLYAFVVDGKKQQ